MDITTASTAQADPITDLWVTLARGQRNYGSHILAAANRTAIREVVLQRIVADNILIARTDSTVVGFIMFRLREPQYDSDVVTGLIENLFVRSEHRQSGVGSELLATAEQHLTDAGADVIHVVALAENDTARTFYAERGYDPHRITFEKATETDTS